MTAEPVIFCVIIFSILAIVVIQQKKNRKLLARVTDSFAHEHYPDQIRISSETLKGILLHFELRYLDVDLNTNIWEGSGYRRNDTLIRDLADIVSDACGKELHSEMFKQCETIKDVIDIAISQNMDQPQR